MRVPAMCRAIGMQPPAWTSVDRYHVSVMILAPQRITCNYCQEKAAHLDAKRGEEQNDEATIHGYGVPSIHRVYFNSLLGAPG